MAENYDLIFGQSASQQYAWSDSDYQNGWGTVGSTPPTAEQFDALQRKSDTKAKDLNDRLEPLETKAEADGRQASTAYTAGTMVTVDGLPNGWLLECVVPGNSGAGAITLPPTLIDGLTIVDDEVTWKLRKVATNGGLGYRQPSTAYTVGQIAHHASLPTGYYLECTTQGTTSSGDLSISSTTIGDTVTDGTVTWTIGKEIGTGNVPIYAGYNQKQTFTSSGTFTAPITGIYRITLQGGGGGGAGAQSFAYDSNTFYVGGAGGGAGANLEFYEKLTAGQVYNYTIGAGGAGGTSGANGSNGGDSAITINNVEYLAGGASGGTQTGGAGGLAKIDNITVGQSECGQAGQSYTNSNTQVFGGAGGGRGGGVAQTGNGASGVFGGGGAGGAWWLGQFNGGAGGDGYITFEWLDTSLL